MHGEGGTTSITRLKVEGHHRVIACGTGLVSVLGLATRGSLGQDLTLELYLLSSWSFARKGVTVVQGHTLLALVVQKSPLEPLSFLRRGLGLSQNSITNSLLCSLSNTDLTTALGCHGE